MERQTVRSASRLAASLIRLPRCYYYTTCKWCMESHLSSDAWPAPCLAALAAVPRVCCVLCPWCLGCPACWCPGRWAVWVGCVPGVLASWPALCWLGCVRPVYGPALWAVWLGLIFRPCIVASLEGLLKKAFIFALYFSGIFSLDFSPLCAGLYFSWFIFPASRSRFFPPDFSA